MHLNKEADTGCVHKRQVDTAHFVARFVKVIEEMTEKDEGQLIVVVLDVIIRHAVCVRSTSCIFSAL